MKYRKMLFFGQGLRWFLYKSFNFVKNRQKRTDSSIKPVKRILIFPACNDPGQLTAILLKINFAFPVRNGFQFFIAGVADTLRIATENLKKRINDSTHSLDELDITSIEHTRKINFKDYNLILCHKAKTLIRLQNHFHKTEIIDNLFYSSTEGLTFQKLYFRLLDTEQKIETQELSQRNFKKLNDKFSVKTNAYCFLTGPCIGEYKSFSMPEKSVKIICNSLVKNKEFIDFIGGPDVITFADPVFHFGASEYAIRFREHMLAVVREHNAFVVVPTFTVPLLISWFPELKTSIIGIDTLPGSFNFPTPEKMWVKASDNIFTMFMLPLAASFSDNIFIAGADGRERKENYFWKFSPDSQFTGEMESVFQAHPSFFKDRKYVTYYKEHCTFVEDLISFAEKKGKIFTSLTPSRIPALSQRYKKYSL